MKLKLILLLLVVSIFSLSSCITSKLMTVEISCDEFMANPHSISNEFEVEVGDKVMVKLCSNHSTGFKWDYEMVGKAVLKEEDYDYEEPEDENLVGAPGTEVWTFEAVEIGNTEVHLEYSQPWEGDTNNEWSYTMQITVIESE
jgi:inhibitor of cysteine peptidase